MFHHPLQILNERSAGISAQRTFDTVQEIIRHHRIQASPGFRDAANALARQLRDAAVETEMLVYPANFETDFWASGQFQEWSCQSATLQLLQPDGTATTLADYSEHKLSLVQRSTGTPPEGITAELVLLENGETEEEYVGLDLHGKIVFTGGDASKVHALAVEKYGALGLITDRLAVIPGLRERYDLPDTLQYTSFWWADAAQHKGFGFVLTPRAGDRLREQLRQATAPLVVQATIDARLYDGEMEVLTAFIPGTGETEEEVLLVSHLCHPQPSANDNASGGATAVEVIRTLSRLINAGTLPRPRRNIRLLMPPEFTGTYAYLATNPDRIPKTIAALNLDMVGENQDLCGGPLVAERPPDAGAGFAGDLFAAIMTALATGESQRSAGTGAYAMFKWAVSPFAGGSDHLLLADPTVGIQCPMLIQWPDKFYHTNSDTIDKVDPQMLRRSGVLAATYIYAIAAAGTSEARWLLHDLSLSYREKLPRLLATPPAHAHAGWRERQAQYLLDRYQAALQAACRLDPTTELTTLADTLYQEAASFTTAESERASAADAWLAHTAPTARPDNEWEQQAAQVVYRRRVPGPPGTHWSARALAPDEIAEEQSLFRRPGGRHMSTLALFWIDGQRTMQEVADQVEAETGRRDTEALVRYTALLAKGGLLERVETTEE